MFYDILNNLCTLKGTTITAVLKSLGISTSKGTAWKNGSVPNGEILSKLADYFETSTDTLLGRIRSAPDNAVKCLDKFVEKNTLSKKETTLIEYYRAHPELQLAVDRVLGIPDDSEDVTIGIAAKGGISTTTADNTAVDKEIAKRKHRKGIK